MKIIICDDEIKYLTDLKKYVEKYMNSKFKSFTIDATTNPNEILNSPNAYDLAFLL